MARKKQDWSPRELEATVRRLAESYMTVMKIAADHGLTETVFDRINDDFERIVRRLGINPNGFWGAVSEIGAR